MLEVFIKITFMEWVHRKETNLPLRESMKMAGESRVFSNGD